jgi:hypothetical protein
MYQKIYDYFYNLTSHVRETDEPQTYLEHGKFALVNSSLLIWAGLLGILHAVCPWWFKFYTSEIVVKSFRKLCDSHRHKDELNRLMPEGYVLKKHLK